MRTLNFGREAFAKQTLLNAGTNFGWQNQRSVTLTHVTASIGLGFPDPSLATGFCEAFVNLWITAPYQAPVFSGDAYAYYQGPPPPTWAGDFANVMSFDTAGNMQDIGAGPPIPGGVFSAILKASAPEATNVVVPISGLSVAVETGSFWVLHMDVQGAARADIEISLSLGLH